MSTRPGMTAPERKETITTMPCLPRTDIYALTDARLSLGRSTVAVVAEMLKAGIRIIQYREKEQPSGAMLEECLAIRRMTREAGCCFIINDHVDIAMLCEADGVHVGQDDLPLWAVRQLVPPSCIVGVSVRNLEEARKAIADGADYLGAGAVFPTGTKTDAVATGLAFIRELTAASPVPVVAIGGINERTIQAVAAHGAQCFAIVSAITAAPDIPGKVAFLRELLGKR